MEIDLGGWTYEDAEKGSYLTAEGWFRCVVEDVAPDSSSDMITVFTFAVTHGPHKGAKVTDRLYDPALAEDDRKAEVSKKRALLFAHRLGLWDGKSAQTLSLDFADTIGTECVLQIKRETYPDKKNAGAIKEIYKPTFNGIFGINDQRIPPDQRKQLGLTAAPSVEANGATASKNGFVVSPESTVTPATPKKPGKPKVDYGSL